MPGIGRAGRFDQGVGDQVMKIRGWGPPRRAGDGATMEVNARVVSGGENFGVCFFLRSRGLLRGRSLGRSHRRVKYPARGHSENPAVPKVIFPLTKIPLFALPPTPSFQSYAFMHGLQKARSTNKRPHDQTTTRPDDQTTSGVHDQTSRRPVDLGTN